jgi:hypothetical protein
MILIHGFAWIWIGEAIARRSITLGSIPIGRIRLTDGDGTEDQRCAPGKDKCLPGEMRCAVGSFHRFSHSIE